VGFAVVRKSLGAVAGTATAPTGRTVIYQQWRHLLFLHWPVPAGTLEPLIPSGLDVDMFEGVAYVGLVAFTIRDVRAPGLPPLPPVSAFHEVNLRTYVRRAGRDPGVWFFSLDAASRLAVIGARVWYRLAYHFARISMEVDENTARTGCSVDYHSERLWPGPKPASCALRYRVSDGQRRMAVAGSLEHFLVERYLLYAGSERRLRQATVAHAPYPLQEVEVGFARQTLTAAARLPSLPCPLHALYSPGVSVRVFAPRRLPGSHGLPVAGEAPSRTVR